MKFCSNCGTMLIPKEKGKGIKLVCPECGHWKKLKDEDDYKISGKKTKKKPEKVAVVEEEEEEKKKKKRIEEETYDIDTDAYAELYEGY